jgi:hypothetical protein
MHAAFVNRLHACGVLGRRWYEPMRVVGEVMYWISRVLVALRRVLGVVGLEGASSVALIMSWCVESRKLRIDIFYRFYAWVACRIWGIQQ